MHILSNLIEETPDPTTPAEVIRAAAIFVPPPTKGQPGYERAKISIRLLDDKRLGCPTPMLHLDAIEHAIAYVDHVAYEVYGGDDESSVACFNWLENVSEFLAFRLIAFEEEPPHDEDDEDEVCPPNEGEDQS